MIESYIVEQIGRPIFDRALEESMIFMKDNFDCNSSMLLVETRCEAAWNRTYEYHCRWQFTFNIEGYKLNEEAANRVRVFRRQKGD